MITCHGCDRHIRNDSRACPFCGVGARATMLAALGLALVACGPVGNDGLDTGESSGMPGTTMPGTTASPSTSGTPTTSGSTTDATTGSTGVDTGTSTSDVDDSGDAPCAFYGGCGTDLAAIPECDVLAQDCPDGEKCMPWANDGGIEWNATRCSPLDPDADAPGEPCMVEGSAFSGIDSCELGAMCWEVDAETNAGTCIELCAASREGPVCSGPDTACLDDGTGVLPLCMPTCDPKNPMCEIGESCVASGDAYLCVPIGG